MDMAGMMAETNAEVAAEPSKSEKTASGGRDRVSSIMDMDYNEDEDATEEPEDNGLSDAPLPSRSDKVEEKKEDKQDSHDEKEDKKPEEKVEELKPEEPLKKTIKYKVDGQEVTEEVTDQDLINSYSGQKALQKRFTEFDRTKKDFEKERQSVIEKHNYVIDEVGQVETGFKSVVDDFNTLGYSKSDPLETVYNLLDKMNVDPASYQKALFFHMIPEVSKFLDMSDEGRDAFLLKKENEWFHKKQHKLNEGQRANSEQKQRFEADNSIKQQYGVTEERFSELKEELVEKFGMNPRDLKTEQVIGWSLEKPAYDRAIALVQKAGVSPDSVMKVAKLLHTYPNTTDDEILDAFGYKDKQAEELKAKLASKIPPKVTKKTQFDDQIDEEFNKRFRRR